MMGATGIPGSDGLKARLLDLHLDCVASASGEQADRIREGLALLAGRRIAYAHLLPEEQPDRAVIEAMLACGAHESAVLALIGHNVGYMLSRGANGACLASLLAAGDEEETVAEGATPALALLAAYAAALLANDGGVCLADVTLVRPDVSRLN